MRIPVWLLVCVLVGMGSGVDAATRTVCSSGCQYSDLQAALDAAVPGDTIMLRAGQTFVGNFRLPAKSSTSTAWITIRSDAPDSSLPPAGVRLIPEGKPGANVARGALARLVGRGSTWKSTPVLRADAGAHHYRLQFLEIDGTANVGYETLIELGNNSSQTTLSSSPHSLVFDRVFVHGHKSKGQKRGIALNSRSTDILNSYICDIKSYSESQGIGGFNGAGPFRIINNYIEGAAENVMFGGSDPAIDDLIPSDIEIRGNHFYKHPSWRESALATPAKPSVSARSGGSLPSGTHYFKVVAVMYAGGATGVSTPSAEAAVTVSSSGAVALSWSAVSGADRYRVYRGTSSGRQSVYLETKGTETSFLYTGSSEKSGTPRSSGMRWVVKNLLEFKNAQRVTVDGNVFENIWAGFQDGYAILFTPRNQYGSAPWVAVRDITFRNNIVRHAGAALKILGTDYNHPTQLTRNIRIVNNVFEDISGDYGNAGRFLVLTRGPQSITVDHNTIFHEGTVVEIDGADVGGFVFTNNMARHNQYGIKGQGSATGSDTLGDYFPGAVVSRNVLAGGSSGAYPSGNYFPSASSYDGQFVDPAAGNYALVSSSPFNDKATDGKDIGVIMSTLTAAQELTAPAPGSGDGDGGDGGGDPTPTDDAAPQAEAGGPYTGAAGTALLFDGSRSTDAEAPLASYRWHFGDEILIRAADVPSGNLHGRWRRVSVGSAAGGVALENTNMGDAKKSSALASPANYVDITFDAAAGVPYYVWLRMRAAGDSYSNDSLYVQFSGSVNSSGSAIYRIGTSSGMAVVLEEGNGAGIGGWGWNDNGYGTLGTPVYFASSGPQTVRVQQREDGIMFDQIVLSTALYATRAPGEFKADDTVLPAAFGTDTGITVQHTYKRAGTYPVQLTVTDSAGQSDTDGAAAAVSTASADGGSEGLVADAGGPYTGSVGASIVFDGRGSRDPDGSIASFRWQLGEDILIRAADVPSDRVFGRWRRVSTSSAAGGVALHNADQGDAKVRTPDSTPSNYFEVPFRAAAGVPYMVWLRMRAEDDHYANDSVFVQYSGSLDASGDPAYRIGTSSAQAVVLEEGSGAGLSAWGWNDHGYGTTGRPVFFGTTGRHTIRIQQREDGVQIDQIVISAAAYDDRRPGAMKGDDTVLPVTLGTVSGSVASHAYEHAGVYPVTLIVTGSGGDQAEDTTDATVR